MAIKVHESFAFLTVQDAILKCFHNKVQNYGKGLIMFGMHKIAMHVDFMGHAD